MEVLSETKALPTFDPSEQQALAVFNHAGEEIRFFKSQQWRVANYAMLTYVALAAIPSWVVLPELGASPELAVRASLLCAALALIPFAWAVVVLRRLDTAIEKESGRINMARSTLPLVRYIHGEPRPRDHMVSSILQAAVLAGMLLVILINVLRHPGVAAWLTGGAE